MDAPGELRCVRHQKPTRITCVTCDTPICPECAIRTAVGFKCPDHASKKATTSNKPSLVGGIGILLIVASILSVVQLARNTGRGEPAKPPCPTETAPDVGIGSEGGTHWKDLPAAGLCGRYEAAAVWTGTELLIWGGENCAGAACPTFRAPHLADGGAYTPATNKWRKLAASPVSARTPAATAWTGNEMLVWGGVGEDFLADGAAYDPARNRWRPMAASPLAARGRAQSAWTGSELIIWGGGAPDQTFADGAAYNPATDRWRPIATGPLAARMGDVAAWTGRELVIWGGVDDSSSQEFRDGAAYDPETDRWRTIAASPMTGRDDPAWTWTGRELLVWGGTTLAGDLMNDGAVYDPATDRWRPMADAPIGHRSGPAAVWSGRELLVWGGFAAPGSTDSGPLDRIIERRTLLNPADDGAAYDPATNRWRSLEPVPLLGRGFPMAVWDGEGMLMWGGLVVVSSPASSSEGVRYTP